jgi:phosphate:Na+ symporter
VIFLPISKYYVRFLEWVVPEKRAHGGKQEVGTYLDERLLNTPIAALRAALQELMSTGRVAMGMIDSVVLALTGAERKVLKRLDSDEDSVNEQQRLITEYLVSVSREQLGTRESGAVPELLHAINDVERIGDHATNMIELCDLKFERNISFSEEATGELKSMHDRLTEMASDIERAIAERDESLAAAVVERQDEIAELAEFLRSNHVRRLEEGKCSLDGGIIFLDAVSHLERVGEHLVNMAEVVVSQFDLIVEG